VAASYEVKAIMKDLADAFPDWKPGDPKGTFEQYERALSPFPYDLLKRAVARCIDSCTFFPKIAEIRKAVSELTANKTTFEADKYFEKQPTSPEVQNYIDEFRRKMIAKGNWREHGRNHTGGRL
jgi:hypothetical protein